LDPSKVSATIRRDGKSGALNGVAVDAGKAQIKIDVPNLPDGKFTVFVDAADKSGHAAKTLRLVFWIESTPFQWNDALIYMVMTDRFQNGDQSNDPKPTNGVDPRADF